MAEPVRSEPKIHPFGAAQALPEVVRGFPDRSGGSVNGYRRENGQEEKLAGWCASPRQVSANAKAINFLVKLKRQSNETRLLCDLLG